MKGSFDIDWQLRQVSHVIKLRLDGFGFRVLQICCSDSATTVSIETTTINCFEVPHFRQRISQSNLFLTRPPRCYDLSGPFFHRPPLLGRHQSTSDMGKRVSAPQNLYQGWQESGSLVAPYTAFEANQHHRELLSTLQKNTAPKQIHLLRTTNRGCRPRRSRPGASKSQCLPSRSKSLSRRCCFSF